MEINIKDSQKLIRKPIKIREPKQKGKPLFKRKNKTSTAKALGKINKRKFPWKKIILAAIGLIVLGAGVTGYLFYKRLQEAAEAVGGDINIVDVLETVIEQAPPEIRKDPSGNFTNILVVGIDTRENQRGLLNTDTIIIASYNHVTNQMVMFSIPRDMYVNVPIDSPYFGRINSVYGTYEKGEEGAGLEALQTTVEKFMGIKIQYAGLIDYNGFKELIDTVGNLTINVENSFTDYRYPTGANTGIVYETIHFDAGIQEMDAETALKYARSRKSLDNGEGSDYARARRQQNVIKALQDKLLSSDTWLSVNKIMGIISSLEDNIQVTEFNAEDIEATINLAVKAKDAPTFSFVFDPLIGNRQVIVEDPNTYVITPKIGAGKYSATTALTQDILSNPKVYDEDPVIRVYDTGAGYYEAYAIAQKLQKEYPYLFIIYQGTLLYDKKGDHVYMNGTQQFKASLREIAGFLDVDTEDRVKPDYISTVLNAEDIVILLGTDVPKPKPVIVITEDGQEVVQ